MNNQTRQEWRAETFRLRVDMASAPRDLNLAKRYWSMIDGSTGYDVRNGRRLMTTFRECALTSEDGLAVFVSACRKIAHDLGELPRRALFDAPLENQLRNVAHQSVNPLSADATWILAWLELDG